MSGKSKRALLDNARVNKRRSWSSASLRACTNSRVRRLAHRAGIKRCHRGLYELFHGYMEMKMARIIHKAAIVANYCGRTTITRADIEHVIASEGQRVYM